jgi:proteasome accessory factor B
MPGPEGDKLTIPYSDVDRFAATLVGYGADVRVESPPELREAVIQQLKEVVTRHEPMAVGT